MKFLNPSTLATALARFLKNRGELKFAFIQVTTRCNARCEDRCNIWASKPLDMKLEDAKFAVDVLAENGFSVCYFTGGETGMYPYLPEAVTYAKQKGMITSLTTNGTISEGMLKKLGNSLDALSVSVDHYNETYWDAAKHVTGISKRAKRTIELCKKEGIQLYGITFLNPAWDADEVERIIQYVNEDLGIAFALSYPYISSNGGTFEVGGKLTHSLAQTQSNVRKMVAKVLEMKLQGATVATSSAYLRDVLRTHAGLPMKYRCRAGENIVCIDCNLDVFPCYKRSKLFNLREKQDLRALGVDNSGCDNKNCLINCFKESSLSAKGTMTRAVLEEIGSNPKFYIKLLRSKNAA